MSNSQRCQKGNRKAFLLFLQSYLNFVLRKVHQVKDFPPNGCCMEKCNLPLTCGHLCTKPCHRDDLGHAKFTCMETCQRRCPRGHACPKPCREKCECVELITKQLPCTHEQIAFCFLEPGKIVCRTIVTKVGVPLLWKNSNLKVIFNVYS